MGTPMAGVYASVYMAANPSIVATNETCNNTDSGLWITYQASVHLFWDKRQPVVVQCSPNGSTGWFTVTDYVFEHAGGVIVFNTARVSGTNNFVQISSGYYWNLTLLDLASKWSISLKADKKDTTVFLATGNWMTQLATVNSGSVKIDTYRSDGRVFAELGALVACQLFVNLANQRWDIIGWVSGIDPASDATGLVTEALTIDFEGECFFRLV